MERCGASRDHDHRQQQQQQQQQQLQPWRFISGSNNIHHECFSWPPRSYTCSFCKREFRSAQALGGHMNVHRRDRARLRNSSTPYNPNNPNPNSHAASHAHIPNLNFFPPAAFIAPLDRVPSAVGPVSTSRAFSVGTLLSRSCHETTTKSAKADNLEKHLRLEIGCGLQEELDLELRLGYA